MTRTALLMTGLLAGTAAFALNVDIVPSAQTQDPAAAVLADTLKPRARCSSRPGSEASRSLRLRFAQAFAAPDKARHQAMGSPQSNLPPLYEGLGAVTISVTSDRDDAQAYFDQGLRFAYGFNHFEAERAFRAAQTLDPSCAMCAWGEALVLGPNINAPMSPQAVVPAFNAIARAQALAETATEKEQALIAALAERYSPDPNADRAILDRAYADAMMDVAETYPDDDNIQVLAAEAIMDTQPWNYWAPDGEPLGDAGTAIDMMETVLARNPAHPAAIHLYIHLTEASRSPEVAEAHAERLAPLVPASGHLVHMPSHTYFVLGRYKDSLDANIDAVAADEAYLNSAEGDTSFYANSYYPHNVHFVLTSAQAIGRRDVAMDAARKLSGMVSPEMMAVALWTQSIEAAPLVAMAQFGDTDRIMAAPKPDDAFPYVQAHWHYARALAFVQTGDLTAASAEADAIAILAADARMADLINGGLPAQPVALIAEAVARGKMAMAQNDLDTAIALFARGVELQDALPYIEPPFWYYPVAQSLGAAYLQAGQLEDAEAAFRKALVTSPNNGWALHGLAVTYERMGRADLAATARQAHERAWDGGEPPALNTL